VVAVAAAVIQALVAAATATTAGAAGLSLVDAQGATHQFGALQTLNGTLFGGFIHHFHEGEATLATRVPLKRKGTVRDLAEGREQLNNVLLFRTEGEVADKNTHWP